MSADGAVLASGGEDKTIKVWNLSTGQQMWTLTGHRGSIDSLAMSANGTFLVSGSGSYDQTLRVWNLLTGKEVWTRDCYPARVAISADGAIIASSHWRGSITLWSLPTGQEIPTLSGHVIGCVKCVATR